MKAIKRLIFAIFLILVLYNTGKFVYENKTLENDIGEASLQLIKEYCNEEAEEVKVTVEWFEYGRQFQIRKWNVESFSNTKPFSGSILKNGTVTFNWSGCEMGEISPSIRFVLDREAKRFIINDFPLSLD